MPDVDQGEGARTLADDTNEAPAEARAAGWTHDDTLLAPEASAWVMFINRDLATTTNF